MRESTGKADTRRGGEGRRKADGRKKAGDGKEGRGKEVDRRVGSETDEEQTALLAQLTTQGLLRQVRPQRQIVKLPIDRHRLHACTRRPLLHSSGCIPRYAAHMEACRRSSAAQRCLRSADQLTHYPPVEHLVRQVDLQLRILLLHHRLSGALRVLVSHAAHRKGAG